MKHLSVVLAALAIVCAGCGHPGVYVQDRASDLLDCVNLEAGPAIGLAVDANVTRALATGFGYSRGQKYGLTGGLLAWHGGLDTQLCLPVTLAMLAMDPPQDASEWLECLLYTHIARRHEAAYDYPFGGEQRPHDIRGEIFLSFLVFNVVPVRPRDFFSAAWEEPSEIDCYEVNVGATLMPVSVRVGVSLGQLADFLVGWTTLDLAGDDTADGAAN